MHIYPARIVKDDGGYIARFRDVPEAVTGATTREETIDLARDALVTAMDFYFEDRRQVPPPSAAQRGEIGIELPPSVSAKVLLLNAMIAARITPAELARRLGTSPQVVTRLVDIQHPTKIDAVATALAAIGSRLTLNVEAL
ncbi:MAG: type II toxin-antitoxin system HicB family antitoxin [Dokdonella sp.]